MADEAPGPGWWKASDGNWYPPSSVPPPPPPPPGSTSAHGGGGVLPVPDARPGPLVRMTPVQWINVAALIVGFIGLLMAWGTAFILSVTGIDTNDGKLFGVILLLAAVFLGWRIMRANRLNGGLLTVAWLALLAIGVYEIVHISSSHVVSVGSGVYVDAVAAALGSATAAIDVAQNWSRVHTPAARAANVQPSAAPASPAPAPAAVVPSEVPAPHESGPEFALGAGVDGPADPAAQRPGGAEKPGWRTRWPWVAGGVAALLIVLGVVLALTLGSSNPTVNTNPPEGLAPSPSRPLTTTTAPVPTTTTPAPHSTPAPLAGALSTLGTAVAIPTTDSGIDNVTVSAWYPGVVDASQFANTPSAGHTWDAIVATTCAGPQGSSSGPNGSDFEALLSNGSTASASTGASGSQFSGPLASLSELNANSSGLSAGQCVTGWVVLSIPPGATPVAVQFSGTSASLNASNGVVKWAIPGS